MNQLDAYKAMTRSHQAMANLLRETLGILQEQQHDGHRRHGANIRKELERFNDLARIGLVVVPYE